MKDFTLFLFFIIIVLCECVYIVECRNNDNELSKALHNLAVASGDAWADLKQISFIKHYSDYNGSFEAGRGNKKMSKMAIPLMFGFKMAGVVISALTALKILLLQSMVLSKFALIGAVVLGVKVLFDHMHTHLYKVTDISHVNSYGHSYPSHLLGVESSQYETVVDPGTIGYAYYTPSGDTTADDLQTHYTTGFLHAAQAKNASVRSASDRLFTTGNKRPNNKVVALKTIIKKTTNFE